MNTAALRPALLTALTLTLCACKEEARITAYTVPKESRAMPARMPANHPPVPGTAGTTTPAAPMQATPGMAADAAGFTTPEWTAPAGWRAKAPTPMRKGDWKIGPADAEAGMTVTVFPGDVGGLAANVNRWAQQLGLPPLTPDELKTKVLPVAVAGAPGAVRVSLANAGRATLAVSAPHGGGTWFFKLSGPVATVTAATADFDTFIASVKFAEAKPALAAN